MVGTDSQFDGLFGQLIATTIEKAKKGDTESARTILRWFCGAVNANTDKKGKPYRKPSGTETHIDERILRYLGECFQKILDDAPGARVDANHALGIREAGKKGNKKTTDCRRRALDIGWEVMERHAELKAERKNSTKSTYRGVASPLDAAIEEVATARNMSDQTVRNAYNQWNKLVRAKYR